MADAAGRDWLRVQTSEAAGCTKAMSHQRKATQAISHTWGRASNQFRSTVQHRAQISLQPHRFRQTLLEYTRHHAMRGTTVVFFLALAAFVACAAGDEPKVAGDEPKVAGDEPKVVEDEPIVVEDAPKAAEDEPKVVEDAPKAAEGEPKVVEDAPKAAEDEPKAAEDEPKAAEGEPKVVEDAPKAAEDEPKAAEDEPKAAEDEPKAAEDEPKAAEDEPKAAEDEPKVVKDKPKVTWEKPVVGFYSEALCPYCRKYVLAVLLPLHESGLLDYVDVQMYASGNAHLKHNDTTGESYYKCQHGNRAWYVDFGNACIFGFNGQGGDVKCAALNTDQKGNNVMNAVRTCFHGDEGQELFEAAYNATKALTPPHVWVPWVVFDGIPMYDAGFALPTAICLSIPKEERPELCLKNPYGDEKRSNGVGADFTLPGQTDFYDADVFAAQ